jgi:hypothetical protein
MTMSEHMKPLAPGEIRQYTVGNPDTRGGWQAFKVMHVAGGSFTQASVSRFGRPTQVLCTDTDSAVAVRAYAEAIEQAESDRIDALDDADDVAFIDSASGELIEPDSAPALKVDRAIAELQRFEEIDRAAIARGESANWWERGTSTPAPTLADEVSALRLWLNHTAEGEAVEWAIELFDRIAGRLQQCATDAQCPGLPLPVGDAVPPCGLFAAHHPHRIGKTIRLRTFGDGGA